MEVSLWSKRTATFIPAANKMSSVCKEVYNVTPNQEKDIMARKEKDGIAIICLISSVLINVSKIETRKITTEISQLQTA